MAWRQLQLVTLAVVMVTATLSAAQQQQAAVQPAAAAAFPLPALPSCPPAPLSLSPCIGYVFGVGSATLTACCSQLRSFLTTQAPCLCAASKLPPNPVGMLFGQAQNMFPNVCDLPNPCDDAAAAGDDEDSAPSVAGTAPPSEATAETTPAVTTTPGTEEPTSSAPAAANPDAPGAPVEPAEDDTPAAATGPAGAGLSKLPQLLHAAGATSSRGMDAGIVFVTVFLASVAAMYV